MLTGPLICKKRLSKRPSMKVSHAAHMILSIFTSVYLRGAGGGAPMNTLQLVAFATSGFLVNKKACVMQQCPLSSSSSRMTPVRRLADMTCGRLLGPVSRCWSPDLPTLCTVFILMCVYLCCHDNLVSRYEFLHLDNEEIGVECNWNVRSIYSFLSTYGATTP